MGTGPAAGVGPGASGYGPNLGASMPKYITTMRYSPGSWARMIASHGDRTKALQHMMEALGGSLDCVYWRFGAEGAPVIGDLSHSVSARALHPTTVKPGALTKG